MLGVTATPERFDGKGLSEVFDALVVGPTVKELIAGGWLSPFVVYAPERQVNLKGTRTVAGDYALGDLARPHEYRDRAGRRVRPSTASTSRAAPPSRSASPSSTRGRPPASSGPREFDAEHLDGDTPTEERHDIIARLGTGETEIVCNCGIISEGLDVPSVGGVILLRPTKSLALYLQQIGRALRPAPGKERAVVLDHSGNVFKHGMPDLEHAWSLDGRPKKTRQSAGPALP